VDVLTVEGGDEGAVDPADDLVGGLVGLVLQVAHLLDDERADLGRVGRQEVGQLTGPGDKVVQPAATPGFAGRYASSGRAGGPRTGPEQAVDLLLAQPALGRRGSNDEIPDQLDLLVQGSVPQLIHRRVLTRHLLSVEAGQAAQSTTLH